jgi:CheY-like chemotaxis protein
MASAFARQDDATARPVAQGTVALVADASAVARASIVDAIRSWDPTAVVLEAATGEAIIEALLAHRPTIAFVAITIPGLTGPEAVAVAKARGVTVPCLVLTSNRVVSRWAEVAQRLDAYEFLKAPFDPRHVSHLLQADRARRTPLRLLLVEASGHGRELIGRVVARSGFTFEIEETDSGRHALKLMRLTPYDVALIDLGLPGIDGLEVACQAHEAVPDTKLIMMTGGDADKLAQAGRHFGVGFVLKKPFFAHDIDLALHNIYGLRRPYLLNALAAAPSANSGLRTQLGAVPLESAES